VAAPAVREARKNFAITLKDADDAAGQIVALVSAFGVVDDQDEELMPGAFKKSIEQRGDYPFPFMWHHKWDDLDAHLGGFTGEETDEGFVITVQFDMEDPDGVKAYRLVKSGRVREFSIGGFEPADAVRREKRGDRDIWAVYEFDLVEVSLVLRGSNPATRVIDVKSAAELLAVTESEESEPPPTQDPPEAEADPAKAPEASEDSGAFSVAQTRAAALLNLTMTARRAEKGDSA
jgi:HK97 family phage prohead protease